MRQSEVFMKREVLESAIEALRAGKTPTITVEDVPAFSEEATKGNEHVSPSSLEEIVSGLTEADIPTLERAIRAIDEKDLAWLGFKIVYDPQTAVSNTDNDVTKKYGDVGSADGEGLLFFCNDAKEIVASRQYSPRDMFQMKDVTRGPSMHNEQFDGLTWASVALFDAVHVWLVGASDVASELSKIASHVGFEVSVIDNDPAFLNEKRFPDADRVVLDSDDFSGLTDITPSPDDYICVLTRGHMYDPEGCIWAARNGAHYIGMMGSAGKNNKVYELVREAGITDEQWESVKRPIGLNFGAKSPAELAIAIVAELIDVRYKQRYSVEAREKHERDLGR